MAKSLQKAFHTGTVKKTIKINASKDKVWRKISNIVGLPSWLVDVTKTEYLSKKKKGVGAIRLITFGDGNEIEEHVVAWEKGIFHICRYRRSSIKGICCNNFNQKENKSSN